ncbi:MAG: prolipoprotein diacylglyceryl transferase [Acutalibacteraceae bacterium]|nr:prolipoprotein diacylglyceryl transferase [Acutalibacteraceae bacterium]
MNVSFPGLGINLEISRQFELFGLNIYWYGVIIALGLILAIVYASFNSKRLGVDPDRLLNCVIVGIITGILGARAYYVLFNWDYYGENLDKILAINEGGLAIYGGIIGALAGGLLVAKIQKMNIPAVLDIASIGFLIGQGIGRWDNFFNQEAYGTETTLPWGMVSEGTNHVIVHPCFLYESLWCLLGVVLLHLFSRSKYRKYSGQIGLLYLVWYGAERAIVEGLRTDSLLLPNTTLRVSQLLSILICALGVTLLVVFYKKKYDVIAVYSATANIQPAVAKAEAKAEPEAEEKPQVKAETANNEIKSNSDKSKKKKQDKKDKKFVVDINPNELYKEKAKKKSEEKPVEKADEKPVAESDSLAKTDDTADEEFFDISQIGASDSDSSQENIEKEIDNILKGLNKK